MSKNLRLPNIPGNYIKPLIKKELDINPTDCFNAINDVAILSIEFSCIDTHYASGNSDKIGREISMFIDYVHTLFFSSFKENAFTLKIIDNQVLGIIKNAGAYFSSAENFCFEVLPCIYRLNENLYQLNANMENGNANITVGFKYFDTVYIGAFAKSSYVESGIWHPGIIMFLSDGINLKGKVRVCKKICSNMPVGIREIFKKYTNKDNNRDECFAFEINVENRNNLLAECFNYRRNKEK